MVAVIAMASPSRVIIANSDRDSAPIAMRTANSLARCATAYDMTPYTPKADIASASDEKTHSRIEVSYPEAIARLTTGD